MSFQFNSNEVVSLLERLVNIPSPSGSTDKVISFIEDFCKELHIETKRNRKGGLVISIVGKDQTKHRMLTGHVDTLGAMVKEVKKNGRLKLTMIGGFRWNAVEGEYCQIATSDGKIYTGTILMQQASVHVYKDAGTAERDEKNIEVRIDEVVKNDEEVKALGISVGDFVSFEPRFERTTSGFIKSRHLDDKASVAILLNIIKEIKENQLELPYTTHFLISNNEEIGYGGNSNITPETVEYLAVDMGAIGLGQTTTEYCVSICAKDSSGPYNLLLKNKLVQLAKEHQLDYEIDIYPYYGSDASAAIRSGHDIVHGLIGPGIAESHSHERTHITSLENTSKLIYHYLLSEMVI
ncbi:M20/M25/M40 family metallo-hydrolase [Anaerobacillus alkaliphilus]|uniref:M20/M25/M40 family metallo-hydrolase n=1 Tax=Anaerobacillus alkaliphilus TaxID=1548597 RepID=A0A4Q0VQW5_9BACI|nr:M42 family metallopeptidase [Anaerobacillus alkaliphilus]RXI99457.1 M20/M25/M40 family metallo-hydrolase [Anaerobacillus alkaliphilus]